MNFSYDFYSCPAWLVQTLEVEREGEAQDPHSHQLLKVVRLSTKESDGSEITSLPLNDMFKKGLFVAMSDDRTFQYYRPEDLLDSLLKK